MKSDPTSPEFQLAVYPNPVIDLLHLVWTAETDEYVQIELADMRGSRIAQLYSGFVVKGQGYRIEWNASNLTDPLYVYRYASATRIIHGKILNTRR